MAKSNEILQVQMPKDNSLVALKQLVRELNQHLFDLSRQPVPYYTHLPNKSRPDFVPTDFISDGQWHTLDLSTILPAQAKLAVIFCSITSDPPVYCYIGAYNEKTGYNLFVAKTAVTNEPAYAEGILDISEVRQLRYLTPSTTSTTIYLVIRGYWSW